MGNLRVFDFQKKKIRTIVEKDETWFVANDVCEAVGIQRTQTRRLAEDEKGVRSMHTLGGKQELAVVNEYGLYHLVLYSRKPEAKAFKRWITHEVIPAIRKTGSYTLNLPPVQPVPTTPMLPKPVPLVSPTELEDIKVLAKDMKDKAQTFIKVLEVYEGIGFSGTFIEMAGTLRTIAYCLASNASHLHYEHTKKN